VGRAGVEPASGKSAGVAREDVLESQQERRRRAGRHDARREQGGESEGGCDQQAAYPSRQVISLSGDGGLAMLLGELITLRQQRLPVKVVVFNNGSLSFVELEMKADGIVTYGTELDNPDFAGIARATGLHAAHVEKSDELEDALRDAFAHDGPALVDVRTVRYEMALPLKLTYDQIKGFTLYATRTILSGEGHELVELAKTNLRDLELE